MKSFKVFDKVKDKKIKNLEAALKTCTMESYMKNTRKFVHIPAEAYKEIHDMPEYSYLKDGLWIQEKKLDYSDDIKLFCDEIGIKPSDNAGQMGYISWKDSKILAERLEGFLMTPAIYFATKNFIQRDWDYMMLNHSMKESNSEWVDAVFIINEWKMAISPDLIPDDKANQQVRKTQDGEIYDLNHLEMSTAQKNYGFHDYHIETRTGLPEKVKSNHTICDYIFKIPGTLISKELAMSMSRFIVGSNYKPVMSCESGINISGVDDSLRLCYKV